MVNERALVHLASSDYTWGRDAQPGLVTRDSVHQPWSSSNTSLIDIVVIDCEVVGGYETPDG